MWASTGLMVMLVLCAVADAAPAVLSKAGSAEPPDPSTSQSDVQTTSTSADDTLTKQPKLSPMTTAPSPGDETTPAASSLGKRSKTAPVPSSASRRAQMLQMLAALENLHRVVNGTLSARITVMARANGKTSVKKNKRVTAEQGGKTTTVPPGGAGGTAVKASTDHINPSSLTGWAFKKSLPPQPKKPNKRVCFWKYCSQN